MANFSALKTAIQNAIKQNGNEEITGDVLQQILLSIVSTMGDGAINTIEQNLSNEATTRQGADTQLQNAINAIKANIDNGYMYAGIATPSSTPVSGKVFYIATAAGTYTNFGGKVLTQGINILRFNGSAWSNQQLIGIDDVPTDGSNKLVKSGGVQNELALGAVYDVSAKNPTAGPNNDGKWESLAALLSDANLNTLIPTAYRKGGMSIKFVQSSDNIYVQYRLMAQTFSTDKADWQKQGGEVVVSQNILTGDIGISVNEKSEANILPLQHKVGYLHKIEYFWYSDNNFDTYIQPIMCKEGEEYHYIGYYGANVVGVLFLNKDNTIISAQTNSSFDLYDEIITIPDGCCVAVFYSAKSTSTEEFVFSLNKVITEFETLPIYLISNRKQIHDGYLKNNGDWVETSVYQSYYIEEVCAEGDKFLYKGRGGGNAVSYIFYNENTVIGYGAFNNSNSKGYEIISTPSNANKVLFSSYVAKPATPTLEVYRENTYLNAIAVNEGSIIKNGAIDAIEHNGYLKSNGTFLNTNTYHCLYTSKIPCSFGDIFYYKGYGTGEAVSCNMYSGSNIVSSKIIDNHETNELAEIIIPNGIDGIVFSSFARAENNIIMELYYSINNFISRIVKSVDNSSSPLYQKKINWLGDSYVANHQQSYTLTWEYLIAQKYNMTYRNYGINGNGIVSGTNPMSTRYANMDNDADYVMVVGGTNDFNYQTPIDTFKSDLGTFIENLVDKYPEQKIAMWSMWNDDGTVVPTHTSIGLKLKDYAIAMGEVCAKYSIPYFNLYSDGGLRAWNEDVRTAYFQSSSDHAHLNAEGHKFFMNRAEKFLESL